MNTKSFSGDLLGWLFGIAFSLVGLINVGWGNDPFFGVFVFLLSLIFYPPVNAVVRRIFGFSIHPAIKVVVALFIAWSSLGVGELFDKIDMMLTVFK